MSENLVREDGIEEVNLDDCEYTFRHYRVPDLFGGLEHYQRGATLWLPAPRGGFTECYLQRKTDDGTGELIGYGFALCSMLDPFCYRTGRSIARGRAKKMARMALNEHIWGSGYVSRRRNALYAPFDTVREIHDYLESKLPARFPFLDQ